MTGKRSTFLGEEEPQPSILAHIQMTVDQSGGKPSNTLGNHQQFAVSAWVCTYRISVFSVSTTASHQISCPPYGGSKYDQ